MKPFWQRLLRGLASEVLPALWEAIQAGDAERAAFLAQRAAIRQAEHLAAERMLDELSKD